MSDANPSHAAQSTNDSVSWGPWFAMAGLMTLILAGLEFMVYRSLAPLEQGAAEGGAVWAPIAIVYELWGFGAAMSVVPAMWLCLVGIVAWQTLLRLRSAATAVTASPPPTPDGTARDQDRS
jgi:hypothetical protein